MGSIGELAEASARYAEDADAGIRVLARGHPHLRQFVVRQMDAFVDHQQRVIGDFRVLRIIPRWRW